MTLNVRGLSIIVTVCGAINFTVCDLGFIEPRNEMRCSRLNGQSSTCLAILQCNYTLDLINTVGILSPEVQNFVKANTCGFMGRVPKVCCPTGSSQNTNNTPVARNKLKLLPIKCGEVFANRIVGGNRTELDEFPWLALMEYQHPRGTMPGCGGVLITKRYVLTAAHCVSVIPSTWKLRNVRLGEYDLRTDPDCLDEGNGERSCTNRVLIVPIEREIVHENFMKPQRFRNDIALLRLDRDIETTRYVQPICLPTSGPTGRLYWSAGWGQTETTTYSNIKLKVSVPYVDMKDCARIYASKGIFLDESQMCAGGDAGKDTCKGDSGGPLMKQVRTNGRTNKWIVDGIVSIGHNPCGDEGWPAVYTKVHDYVPWILDKITL